MQNVESKGDVRQGKKKSGCSQCSSYSYTESPFGISLKDEV